MRVPFALGAVVLLLAGCASGPNLDLSGAKPLAAGGFLELNLRMEAGDRISYDWSSDAPVEFNIHTHGAGGVQDFVQEQATAKSNHFEAPADGVYSLMWENKATRSVTVSYAVSGQATQA
jgi:hypothetical protein